MTGGHPAEKDAPHCRTCTCGCTCGYGGLHEPENPRCELNRRVIPPANPCAEMVGRVLADYGPNGGRALAERGGFPPDKSDPS